MKPLDILDALSDLPEDYAALAVQKTDPQSADGMTQDVQTVQEGIGMNMQKETIRKRFSLPFGTAGIAAAVAVCVGLNAALIYGISKMKTAGSAPLHPAFSVGTAERAWDPSALYMELADEMSVLPTAVSVLLFNHTDAEIAVSESFAVLQDGVRVAACRPVYWDSDEPDTDPVIPPQTDSYLFALGFDRLPAGQYTLCSYAEDGISPGRFGSLDFEISTEFDDMEFVPEQKYREGDFSFTEVKAELEEMGFQVEKHPVQCHDEGVMPGDVLTVEVEPVRTEQDGDVKTGWFYYDGSGYWTARGGTVSVTVCSGMPSGPAAVPDVTGKDYEAAKTVLTDEGFVIDKRSAYDDEVPEGVVIKTSPEPGTESAAGSYVTVTVSMGRRPSVYVPYCTGKEYGEAERILKETGLEPEIRHACDPDVPAGCVICTDPAPGEEITEGGTVQVTVSLGQAAEDNSQPQE